jgi:DNA-binding HxlR family transcriptional regulator
MGTGPELCVRFHKAVELIGRRWSGAVIQILLQRGRTRYGELRAAIPDISDRMLSERLRELEEEGVVVRTVVPDTPVRVEYELTHKGRALESSLSAIGQWAERWVEGGAAEPEAARSRAEPAPPPRSRQRPATRRVVQRRR